MAALTRRLVALLVGLLIAACTTQPLAIDTAATTAAITHDELYLLRNTAVDMGWARKDLDLTGYNKVIVQGAGIQYRPVKARAGSRFNVSSDNKFPISEENKVRLRRELTIAFTKELAKGENFEVVTTPGLDALIARG